MPQYDQTENSFSVQPAIPTRRITSFSVWMEAWNVYLAVRVSLNPLCTPHLIAYQRIITTSNSQHPLHAWITHDEKFHTKAAGNSSLRWDIWDLDLWLECFSATLGQSARWPCTYCGGTNYFPNNCPFRPPSTSTHGGGQPASGNFQQRPVSNCCRDYNQSICFCRN